jgi:hypothetical protein
MIGFHTKWRLVDVRRRMTDSTPTAKFPLPGTNEDERRIMARIFIVGKLKM